ncbi:endolytic transglycosylase MltG, partial [bacterium]|nr:endolytic transglycosylase MltG [bacterium]
MAKPMKYLKLAVILLLILTAIAVTLSGFDLYSFAQRGNQQPATIILIDSGSSLNKIAHILTQQKLISSKRRFVALNRLLQSTAQLKAGEYQIDAGANPLNIITVLQQGVSFQRKISFPEGFTLEQIGARLKAQGLDPAD